MGEPRIIIVKLGVGVGLQKIVCQCAILCQFRILRILREWSVGGNLVSEWQLETNLGKEIVRGNPKMNRDYWLCYHVNASTDVDVDVMGWWSGRVQARRRIRSSDRPGRRILFINYETVKWSRNEGEKRNSCEIHFRTWNYIMRMDDDNEDAGRSLVNHLTSRDMAGFDQYLILILIFATHALCP